MDTLLEALRSPWIEGLSILGGDPLEPYNVPSVSRIVAIVKELCPEKSIWLWTGRKYEDIKDEEVLKYIDVLVDGPFIERKKVTEQGKYYGSTNQRIIRIHEKNEESL
jgi:anaerobic ribonucleoside-triphosphate reductase activating protein